MQIAIEEPGFEYRIVPIDIGAGDQFKPEFLTLVSAALSIDL